MKTRVTELLGIEYPIIQGGMAWVADHHIAAAVSEAGGLGLIAAANAPAEWVREQIRGRHWMCVERSMRKERYHCTLHGFVALCGTW